MKCVFLAYLDQKVSFKVKIYSFLTFMLINFLVQTLQCNVQILLISHLFSPRKRKYEKNPLKSNILEEIFSTVITDQSAQIVS